MTWPYLCNALFNTKRLKEIGGFRSKHNLFQDVTAEMILAARFGRADVEAIKASSRKPSGAITCSGKVMDGWEDSLELLDLLCGLAQNKNPLVRRKGMRFFAWIDYNRAGALRSPCERIRQYFVVFKKFNYEYSPITFLI